MTKSPDFQGVFIGYDSSEQDAYYVLEHSLRKHTPNPDNLRITPVDLDYCVKRFRYQRNKEPNQSTEFTYLRFLVPAICGYKGIAIFMDCDMLCQADIMELLELPMDDYALRVVKHNQKVSSNKKMDGKVQETYPRKNWSSLMIMNCAKLRCWDLGTVETAPGSRLHRFEDIPDELIGDIPADWNTLDSNSYSIKTDYGYQWDPSKLIHYTSGGPWHSGYENCSGAKEWYRAYYEMMNGK